MLPGLLTGTIDISRHKPRRQRSAKKHTRTPRIVSEESASEASLQNIETPEHTWESFDGYRLPTDILCEVLEILNELDNKPPQALCQFMRVCRRFRDIACAAHSLWAQHVLAPLNTSQDEARYTSLVATLAERATPVLLSLRLPPGFLENPVHDFPKELLPSLSTRVRCIIAGEPSLLQRVDAFWEYLRTANIQHLDTVMLRASPPYVNPLGNRCIHEFPRDCVSFGGPMDLPSLRNLRLVNALPPCPFPSLRSLSIDFIRSMRLRKSVQDFITYLQTVPQLTHLVLHGCLVDATDDTHTQPIELAHLQRLELMCAPEPCALFLEHINFPATTVIVWRDMEKAFGRKNDPKRMLTALHEHLKPVAHHPCKAYLRISDKEDNSSLGDILRKDIPMSLSWFQGPCITFALYRGSDASSANSLGDLMVQLESKCSPKLLRDDNLSRLIDAESINSLTVSSMDHYSNAFLNRHMLNILRSFPAIEHFTWMNLTTPETLAPILTDVLDPFRTPLLQSLRICELGHPTGSQWEDNASVVALCEEMRARKEEGYPLGYIPRIDKVVYLESDSNERAYMRGQEMARGEPLNELWDMLANAQGGD